MLLCYCNSHLFFDWVFKRGRWSVSTDISCWVACLRSNIEQVKSSIIPHFPAAKGTESPSIFKTMGNLQRPLVLRFSILFFIKRHSVFVIGLNDMDISNQTMESICMHEVQKAPCNGNQSSPNNLCNAEKGRGTPHFSLIFPDKFGIDAVTYSCKCKACRHF